MAVSTSGKVALPGMIGFQSINGDKLAIDSSTGIVTLLDNHYEDAVLKAKTCPNWFPTSRSATINVKCNLSPSTVGDVDLGSSNGVPVSGLAVSRCTV